MALAKVLSCAVVGLDGELIEVEVDVSNGQVGLTIVGLPDAAVQEAKERVRSAIRNGGFQFPLKRITVNLAPADIRKEGPAYDLPIAVGVLVASQQVVADVERSVFLGELALDGNVRHAHGVLPMVGLAKNRGIATAFVPESDVREASLIDGVRIMPVRSLSFGASTFDNRRSCEMAEWIGPDQLVAIGVSSAPVKEPRIGCSERPRGPTSQQQR